MVRAAPLRRVCQPRPADPPHCIADLESGRRALITVLEFLTIAQALDLNPADLLPHGEPAAWSGPESPYPLPAIRRKVAELSRLIETTS
jgi:hypothetical protein